MRQGQVFPLSIYGRRDVARSEEEEYVATRALTIQLNGAEWLELLSRAGAASCTIPAYVRTLCGLPAWLRRGEEMAGRTSSARRPTSALERRSVTVVLTDQEYERVAGEASQAGQRLAQFVRTRCGFQVRNSSLPGTDEREDEADDAWERLKGLGLEPQDYFKE